MNAGLDGSAHLALPNSRPASSAGRIGQVSELSGGFFTAAIASSRPAGPAIAPSTQPRAPPASPVLDLSPSLVRVAPLAARIRRPVAAILPTALASSPASVGYATFDFKGEVVTHPPSSMVFCKVC